MKKVILTSLAVLATAAANAGVSPYVSGKLVYGNFGIENTKLTIVDVPNQPSSLGSDETDWAPGVRAAVGAKYDVPAIMGAVRGELELGYHAKSKYEIQNKTNPGTSFDGEISYLSGGVNVFYDFDTKTKFKPYVGAGVGLAQIDYSLRHESAEGNGYVIGSNGKENNFKWNIGAGVSYAVLPNLDIDLGYRYTNYGKLEEKATDNASTALTPVHPTDHEYDVSADLSSHEVSLGVRYTF